MAPGLLRSRDGRVEIYPPAAKKRRIDGEEEETDKNADRGKSSSSSGESKKSSSSGGESKKSSSSSCDFSGRGEEFRLTECESQSPVESDSEPEYESEYEFSPEALESISAWYDSNLGSSPESSPESKPLPPDLCKTDGEFDEEKYYNVVFNLKETRGRFCNCLQAMKANIRTYRKFRNMVNGSMRIYNKENHTRYKAGEIVNCVRTPAGGYEYFFTFNAKDRNTGTKNVFQASVYEAFCGHKTFDFCWIREDKEPCGEDDKCI